MPFSPEYVRFVLNENFEDAKALFLEPLLAIHRAHLVMLADCGIVSREDARRLRDALDAICCDSVRRTAYDGSTEDLFFHLDRLIVDRTGEDVAGRLHTARSRNDIDMTMYRMRQRGFVLDLFDASLSLREALLDLADAHRETIFAAHTHTQPAQPTTLAHYLLGAVEQLERDAVRLRAAYETTNRCPLGACAITGTGFPIDRQRTSDLLGFSAPTGNTYGSIATVDYMLESLSAAGVLLAGVGRVVQDLLLWCTAEVRYLRLADGFVQTSSIMPQKRNPVALEHARSIGSKALGQAAAVMMTVHNTPFGDIVDTEDDLQPLVHAAFRDGVRATALVAAALRAATFDTAIMAARARESWITVTELADTLARDHGLAFSRAHKIAAGLVEAHRARPGEPLPALLAEVSARIAGAPIVEPTEKLDRVLSPDHFVRVRTTPGGPAPERTGEAVRDSKARLDGDRAFIDEASRRLARANECLAAALEAL
jgi:argininosuccinate lyase